MTSSQRIEARGRPVASVCTDRLNALSIDVEDYYQVAAFVSAIPREDWSLWPARVDYNTRRVLGILAEAGAHATFFVLGCIAQRYPALVRAVAADGHEIASHGWSHRRIWEQTAQEFTADVADAKHLLEDIVGLPVAGYRAPSFSIDQRTWWAFDVLAEAGYRYSSSVNPIRHDHYGMPDAPRQPFAPVDGITEIPIATVQVGRNRLPCGGGGYFRLLPYAVSSWSLRRLNEIERCAAVFYFHPWEIDPGQPRVKDAPLRSRFRHYVNLEGMEGKLRRLLRDFAWSRIDDVFLNDEDFVSPAAMRPWEKPMPWHLEQKRRDAL